MPLLADYALTPDVFDVTSYTNEEVCGLHLNAIREVLLTEGLVRNLNAGGWLKQFADGDRDWHRRGTELLKKLAKQGRLIEYPASGGEPPTGDCDWCREALATYATRLLTGGIIATESAKSAHPREPIVAQIDKLPGTRWWTSRSSSVRLPRTLAAYKEHLDPVLRCANSILFIDPYLDPSRRGYQKFGELVALAGKRTPAPLIEAHRVCWEKSRDKRLSPEVRGRIEKSFKEALTEARTAGVRIKVFLWDDFHDRYLISNLIGISLPNGFDTTADPRSITRWTRLGRTDRDDVQREFDPASNRHTLSANFEIA